MPRHRAGSICLGFWEEGGWRFRVMKTGVSSLVFLDLFNLEVQGLGFRGRV